MKQAPAVILVRPTEEGNVGAVARAMANTGLDRLILVEPAVEIGETARARAVSGAPILAAATRSPSLEAALAPFRHVVGTSSHRGRSVRSRVIEPRQLAGFLEGEDPTQAALVFGPERSGLTTPELALCATIVRIPTAVEKPTLNLAQAVLIVAYELFVESHLGPGGSALPGESPVSQGPTREDGPTDAKPHDGGDGSEGTDSTPAATAAQIAGLLGHVDSVLDRIGFARDTTYAGVLLDLRRLAGRARLTEREVAIFRGLCRRLEHSLARQEDKSA